MKTNYPNVQLVFFSSKTDELHEKIAKSIPELISERQIYHSRTVKDFSLIIRKMLYGYGIILILVRDEHELKEILKLKTRLQEHQSIILILPDSNKRMMQESSTLYPRYTSYIKDEYNDVFLVLEKMINKIEKRIKGE